MPTPLPALPVVAPDVAPDSGDRLRGRLMAQALGKLLDRVRGARDVLPHLAALERGLTAGGTAVIDRVPRPALAKLCSQLSSLPLPEDDPALQDLLSRLMDALEGRKPAASRPGLQPLMPDRDDRPFDMERTVVIQEVSHSDFMAVARGESTAQHRDP
ncbi:MAG: hypothetical protein IPF94_07780 [Betaproteobacteria bacterium]|nr:hypothetical protein [Betaproteobacteria bacterium]